MLPTVPPHLQVVRQIGKGAYGEVFLCTDRTKPTEESQVAIKWVRDFARDAVFGKRILREIRILAALDHPNLLKLEDLLPVSSPNFKDVYIVMPYMHTDLHKVIYSKNVTLESRHEEAFACQILRGLKYLHSAGVVHRDLKPSNILVNQNCLLRIADLGLARGKTFEEEDMTDYVVTRWYRAPELILLPSGYFEAVDLWSVGCIHVELLGRRPLFPGENHVDMCTRIAATLGFLPARDLAWLPAEGPAREGVLSFLNSLKLPETPVKPLEHRLPKAEAICLDFLKGLLDFDPKRRLSATRALEHGYLEHLRDPEKEQLAPAAFPWDFDRFEATSEALKERVYREIAQLHPEMLQRHAENAGPAQGPGHPKDSSPEMPERSSESGRAEQRRVVQPQVKSSGMAAKMPLGPPPSRAPQAQGQRTTTKI